MPMDALLIQLKVDKSKIWLSILPSVIDNRFLIIVMKPCMMSEWKICYVSIAINESKSVVQSKDLISG